MRNRYPKLFALALFASLALVAFATESAAQTVVRVSLRAERLALRNTCPTTVDFRGTISVRGRGTVRYTFERSDGATGPVNTLFFPGTGTREVSATWTLGRSYNGYEKLVVLSPNRMESPEARFNLNCEGMLEEPPTLPGGGRSIDIFCPITQARTEMVTPLPEGWWQTPQIGSLVSLGIQTIGGEQTMVCRYSAYGTQVSVMRRFPERRRDCRVTGTNRFTCR